MESTTWKRPKGLEVARRGFACFPVEILPTPTRPHSCGRRLTRARRWWTLPSALPSWLRSRAPPLMRWSGVRGRAEQIHHGPRARRRSVSRGLSDRLRGRWHSGEGQARASSTEAMFGGEHPGARPGPGRRTAQPKRVSLRCDLGRGAGPRRRPPAVSLPSRKGVDPKRGTPPAEAAAAAPAVWAATCLQPS